MSSRILLLLVSWGASCGPLAAGPAKSDPRAERHFVEHVLPVLQSKCQACHGQDGGKLKGGLDLRSRSGVTTGGQSGQPAVVAGRPADSPLWLSVSRKSADWSAMPPKESDQLTPDQLTAIKSWIEAGAPWPTDQRLAELKAAIAESAKNRVVVKTTGGLSADWTNRRYAAEDLWAYRPVSPPRPGPGSVDGYLDRELERLGLAAAPPADRRALLRRVTFDLTGLPPTPREVADFLADASPDDRAFAAVVERLLASPHYGERMAQHWLDVARYADSAGFANDYERGTAWRYRDYVVRSFNADKPYDRFVREQLAGDEIDPTNAEAVIATGFLRMGPWELTGMEVPKVARQRFLDDVTDSVGQTFLAQPLQCARCHDHKFDPIPTGDYYAIQAVFATTQIADRPAEYLPGEVRAGFDEQRYLEGRRDHYASELAALAREEAAAKAKWAEDHPLRPGVKPPREKYLTPAQLGRERIARKELERLAWRLDRYKPVAVAVYSGHTPDVKSYNLPPRIPADRLKGEREATAILTGGDPFAPAASVAPGVLSAANGGRGGAVTAEVAGRRAAFAEWVASADNPLTARVMVNRIWAWHFGTPLAGNPNNFGATGKKPTHPDLLDWLAAEFVRGKWSVKDMHRLIVSSRAYRRSARHPRPEAVARLDPLGTSYAAFRPRRLSAEELRDSILAASGELNLRVGGIPCRPEMNPEAAFQPRQVMGTFAESWQPNPKPEDRHRRSLYVLKLRGLRDPFFEVFNQPGADSSCELRETSTVAPQAFTLFNAEASYRRALALAASVRAAAPGDAEAIRAVFARALGRPPTEAEEAACLSHWQAMTARHGKLRFEKRPAPRSVEREAIDENTGERFRYTEPLEFLADFVPDRHPADCPADVRGLAEVCLVLLNTNEFATVE